MSEITQALEVLRKGRFIDLTHTVHSEIPRFGPFPKLEAETAYTVEKDGFFVKKVTFVTQYGTHIDAPEHFVVNRRKLDDIDVRELILPICVIHREAEVAENPDYVVTKEDILAWEAENGKIPADSVVAFSSGWSRRWESGDMENKDEAGVPHSPGWGLDALEFLFRERGITAVGHETLDTDASSDVIKKGFLYSEKFVLNEDKFQVELLTNLDQVPSTGGIIFIGVPKFKGLPGFPVRAVAIVP